MWTPSTGLFSIYHDRQSLIIVSLIHRPGSNLINESMGSSLIMTVLGLVDSVLMSMIVGFALAGPTSATAVWFALTVGPTSATAVWFALTSGPISASTTGFALIARPT